MIIKVEGDEGGERGKTNNSKSELTKNDIVCKELFFFSFRLRESVNKYYGKE